MVDVAIVDYGLGNIFSIEQACKSVGLSVEIVADAKGVKNSRSIILPGVGAFGDAMAALERLDLISVLQDVARQGKRILGICLGLQLLFSCSEEFGQHEGLGILKGRVEYFPVRKYNGRKLKIPQVGWNEVEIPEGKPLTYWDKTLLNGFLSGTPLFFVHSCYVLPDASDIVLCESTYGDMRFCSGCMVDNIVGFQFHPERSGFHGLSIYKNFAKLLRK